MKAVRQKKMDMLNTLRQFCKENAGFIYINDYLLKEIRNINIVDNAGIREKFLSTFLPQ